MSRYFVFFVLIPRLRSFRGRFQKGWASTQQDILSSLFWSPGYDLSAGDFKKDGRRHKRLSLRKHNYIKTKFLLSVWNQLTWDQALFSFRFVKNIPAVAVRENVWEPLKIGLDLRLETSIQFYIFHIKGSLFRWEQGQIEADCGYFLTIRVRHNAY